MEGLRRLMGAALAALLLDACATSGLPDFDPVNLESGTNAIRLVPVGRLSGGFFDRSASSPPTYDPVTKRVYVVATDLGRVDVFDISDPERPQRSFQIEVGGFPSSVDIKNGILAVSLRRLVKTNPGSVVFFDAAGERIGGGAVLVGPQPNALKFTPAGDRVVVLNAGEANEAYTIDPEGSVTIIDLGSFSRSECRAGAARCRIDPDGVTADFTMFNDQRAALTAAGVRIYGPNATVAQDLEPEALAISPDSRTAWVSLQRNNAVAVIDIPDRRVREIIPLGSKDNSLPGNGLDASNRDGAINIQPWPVRSLYQPDIFEPFMAGSDLFLVTANEGDPRDFQGFSEEVRVRELALDPGAFPNAGDLRKSSAIGRLKVTNVTGDTDGDGDFDQLFAIGARSFATWTEDWQLVFDSGDSLEQVMAQAVPDFFNASDDNNRFDAKSDSRGPEPETLAVGEVDGRTYVFIAPERIGGVYVYDITDPAAPFFVQYTNLRNFAVDPDEVCQKKKPQSDDCAAAGDLGPEGILFIAQADSPIDAPLVVVNHEVSDSVTIYRVDRTP